MHDRLSSKLTKTYLRQKNQPVITEGGKAMGGYEPHQQIYLLEQSQTFVILNIYA